jgi:hypothetical protein
MYIVHIMYHVYIMYIVHTGGYFLRKIFLFIFFLCLFAGYLFWFCRVVERRGSGLIFLARVELRLHTLSYSFLGLKNLLQKLSLSQARAQDLLHK